MKLKNPQMKRKFQEFIYREPQITLEEAPGAREPQVFLLIYTNAKLKNLNPTNRTKS